MSTKLEVTRIQLRTELGRKRTVKHIRYCVWVRPFMPTGGNLGFEGCALAAVTRKEFTKVANDLLENFEARGARIALTVPTQDFEAFII